MIQYGDDLLVAKGSCIAATPSLLFAFNEKGHQISPYE